MDGDWELLRQGRFPDRYVDGPERAVAEALWADYLETYPGLKDDGPFRSPPSLATAAAGYRVPPFAVGDAGGLINKARTAVAALRRFDSKMAPADA